MAQNEGLALRYAARSDVGVRRESNEDSGYASARLLAVADGMGGHAGGEVASSLAVTTLAALDERLPVTGADLQDALRGVARDVNHALREMAEREPALRGMGTTFTAMLWDGAAFALAHVGDSRAYMLRDGALFQITHDHTLVQSLVDDGRITPEQAAEHPRRSMVLRVLEGTGDGELDLTLREARPGDRYLLCSDGLTAVVGPETLFNTLTDVGDPDEAARLLIDLANRGGGPDNITCVIADFGPHPASAERLVVGAATERRLTP
ncbi:serine/threonine-protein phosphatase [Planomonospora sp. ID91781]|uniref:PP2C family protein-serine/threonine phosphatase n=1 Tax=Planomonospora sp. ID91781 TaxID=2738135 RepID=UPI0018C407D7|nr:PP2C family serine/threonine-protein phosphatase [Planomonospora sp. ID91781]MBG0821125.1 serine/threonine-protein phosphatase [Planomonospora sp. ID91781]